LGRSLNGSDGTGQFVILRSRISDAVVSYQETLVREKAFEFIPYGAHLVVERRVPGDPQYDYGFAVREFLCKLIMQFGAQNGMRSKPYEVNYQLGCGPDPVSMATDLFHQ
tara:strand:- start:215 stop:544 length:330 start_codon:yes stop_codon:yes gene_type:complete